MARIWDISPPKRKRKLKPAEKKERRANISWFFFLAVVAAFFIVFFGASKIPLSNDNPSPSIAPVPSAKISPSPSNSKSSPTIKLLNGTGRVEETQKVRDALKNAGFTLTATENALNIYRETIIYYQPQFENYARNLAAALATYKPKTQKFTQETQYDIVIVIGTQ